MNGAFFPVISYSTWIVFEQRKTQVLRFQFNQRTHSMYQLYHDRWNSATLILLFVKFDTNPIQSNSIDWWRELHYLNVLIFPIRNMKLYFRSQNWTICLTIFVVGLKPLFLRKFLTMTLIATWNCTQNYCQWLNSMGSESVIGGPGNFHLDLKNSFTAQNT